MRLRPHPSLGALGTAAGQMLGNVGDRAGRFMHSLNLMGSRVSCVKALPCPCSGKICQHSWHALLACSLCRL